MEIRVSDSGIGIPPEFLPYVFDRFRQAESTTTRQHGGLGLGLSIVRHLVELHGGTVEVESSGDGRGAVFTVRLPVRPASSTGAAAETAAAPAGEDAPPMGDCPDLLAGVRVLVLDDEADTRDLLVTTLEHCGAFVTAAASVAEALAALDRSMPDVLVSDIGVPGEDGYSLIRKVRAREAERGGHLPAAALTAYARTEDRLRALAAGFQTHIAKPVDPSELVARVAALVGRHATG